jgi:RNA polymerase sigma-70 factor (ECF subfamily)
MGPVFSGDGARDPALRQIRDPGRRRRVTEPLDRPAASESLVVRRQPLGGGDATAPASDLELVVMTAYEAHNRDLLAFARALVRDPEAAEDLVADAFLRLINEVRAGRTPMETRGWLYRVVANLVVSRGRRLRTAQRFLSRLVDRRVQESPESRLVRSEIRGDLLVALAALPIDGRVALVMAARGSTGQEIAAALGKSETATRTALYRARMKLREQLSEGVER